MNTQSKPHIKVQLLEGRLALVKVNARLAYITETFKRVSWKGNSSKIVATYIGFNSYKTALEFAQKLTGKRVSIRPSKRLLGCAFEVKVNGLTAEEIEAIAKRLVAPQSTISPAVKPIIESLPVVINQAPSPAKADLAKYDLWDYNPRDMVRCEHN